MSTYAPQETNDGQKYHSKHSFTCPNQLEALRELFESMAERPQEYVNREERFTKNVPEGYHGVALAYREKRIDVGSVHYSLGDSPPLLGGPIAMPKISLSPSVRPLICQGTIPRHITRYVSF